MKFRKMWCRKNQDKQFRKKNPSKKINSKLPQKQNFPILSDFPHEKFKLCKFQKIII